MCFGHDSNRTGAHAPRRAEARTDAKKWFWGLCHCSMGLLLRRWRRRRRRDPVRDLDMRVLELLRSSKIRLLSADFLRKLPVGSRLENRQDLEARSAGLLPPEAAAKALARGTRAVAVLSYGWRTRWHPDPDGLVLANVVAFLNSPDGANVEGVFWDFSSLYQQPRMPMQDAAFREALNVMGDLYASPLGTQVLIHAHIPPRPKEYDGVVCLLNASAATASDVRRVLCGGGEGESGGDDDGNSAVAKSGISSRSVDELDLRIPFMAKLREDRQHDGDHGHSHSSKVWRAKFHSHEEAQAAVAALSQSSELAALGTIGGGAQPDLHLWYNDTAYHLRGWPTFESAVSTELLARLQYYPHLRAPLVASLPPKVLELNDDGLTWRAIGLPEDEADGAAHAVERVQNIRNALARAIFSGRGDAERVKKMYNDYIGRIARAFNAAGVLPSGSYEGDRDAQGRPHGEGLMQYVDGSRYRGQWYAGAKQGDGVVHYETGGCYVGGFHANQLEGNGTFWHADGRIYQGGYRADHRDGPATLWDSGEVAVSRFSAGCAVGPGVLWSSDGTACACTAEARTNASLRPILQPSAHSYAPSHDIVIGRVTTLRADDMFDGKPVATQSSSSANVFASSLFIGESSAHPRISNPARLSEGSRKLSKRNSSNSETGRMWRGFRRKSIEAAATAATTAATLAQSAAAIVTAPLPRGGGTHKRTLTKEEVLQRVAALGLSVPDVTPPQRPVREQAHHRSATRRRAASARQKLTKSILATVAVRRLSAGIRGGLRENWFPLPLHNAAAFSDPAATESLSA